MSGVRDLVETLKGRLAAFGYRECENSEIGDLAFAAVLAASGRRCKLFCAVADLPHDVVDADGAARYVGAIRRELAKAHAGFPWPKRVGTYTVLLGRRELCRRLRGHEGRLIDSDGLHVNVMLGTVLVDVDTHQAHSDTTWGLIDTGDQFREIQAAVEEWCRRRRRQGRLAWTAAGRSVNVA